MPSGGVLGDPAAGDQAVCMRGEVESVIPGVKQAKYANGAANVAWITSEFDDGVGGGLHQCGITVALMAAQHLAQLSRHGGGDVEVWHRQHLRLAMLQPLLGLCGMTLWAAAVLAGMEREHLALAGVALPELTAECWGATGKNILDGTLVRRQHRCTVRSQVVRREAAEHIG